MVKIKSLIPCKEAKLIQQNIYRHVLFRINLLNKTNIPPSPDELVIVGDLRLVTLGNKLVLCHCNGGLDLLLCGAGHCACDQVGDGLVAGLGHHERSSHDPGAELLDCVGDCGGPEGGLEVGDSECVCDIVVLQGSLCDGFIHYLHIGSQYLGLMGDDDSGEGGDVLRLVYPFCHETCTGHYQRIGEVSAGLG